MAAKPVTMADSMHSVFEPCAKCGGETERTLPSEQPQRYFYVTLST